MTSSALTGSSACPEEEGGQDECRSAVVGALRKLLLTQQRRAVCYNRLERSLKTLAPSSSAQTLSAVTAEFSECSSVVKGIEVELERENEVALADLVRDIQEKESSKLQLTVRLQTLKKNYSEACKHEGKCQCEEQSTESESVFSTDVLYRTSLREILKQLELVIRSINENIEQVHAELEDRTEEEDGFL